MKSVKSEHAEDRTWASRALQNIAADASSKKIISTPPILTLLISSATSQIIEEQVAAVGALLNLSTELGEKIVNVLLYNVSHRCITITNSFATNEDAIVPITGTKNVVATLVHLAHSQESSGNVRHMACDTLANISMWLQNIAGRGTVPDGIEPIPLPSHIASGWQRWD